MVVRPGGSFFRFLTWTASCLAAIGAVEARSPRRQRDSGPELAAAYALVGGAKIKVGQAVAIDGDVHSNDDVDLKRDSIVRGDVSAARVVKNQGGTVIGSVVEYAPAVPLPSTPSKDEALSQANRGLTGPVKLIDPIVDDVLFVAGAVTIEGVASGGGTLIATGPIAVVTRDAATPAGGSSSPAGSSGRRLSILTFADLTMMPRSELHATARARGRAMLAEQATFEGTLVADREIELARGARVRFGRPADTASPSLTILGPPQPLVTDEPSVDLTVLYADADPGVDLASFSLRFDGALITDGCSVGESVAFCSLDLTSSGPHEVAVAISDLTGNAASRTLAFTAVLDTQPPVILIESPVNGALVADVEVTVRGTVTDDGAIEVVTIGGTVVDAPGGRFAQVLALDDGANLIRITARDSTEKESEANVAVTLDREPPRVTIRTPAAVAAAQQSSPGPYPLSTNLPSIAIAGLADDEHGVERVEIEGAPVTLASGEFDHAVALEAGVNRVIVEATDRAGNVASVELEIDRSTAPSIAIVEPEDGAVALERSIAVRGTVSDLNAAVTVNGVVAAVSGTTFVAEAVALGDGATLINALAVDASGLEGAAGVTVLRDVEAPQVAIHDPVEGSVIYAPEISVVGMVNDVVVGTVNGAQVTVTVNGVAAEVANRSFMLDRVPLAIGDNAIEVTATDRGGNVGRDEVVVRREPQVGPVLSAISGDRQTGVVGEVLPLPMVVSLRDPFGVPVPDRIVTFVADGTDGTLGGGKREVAVSTNGAGRASAVLTLGRRAGHHSVRATATGVAGEALFVLRAVPGVPAVLVVDSGDQQVGVAGQSLRSPLAVVVTDEGFNRLEGAVVGLEVIEGDGVFQNGEPAIDLVSDSDGRVAARLTLSPEEGVGNNVVRARLVDGPPGAEATLAASALVAKEPATTAVSGLVLDNTDRPVPGATVTLEGTTLSTRSDDSGFFRLVGAPPGTMHLRVNGSTVERPGVWPSLEFLITVISGRDNSMGRPIFLPELETENALAVDETTGGVLTIHDLPGFALEIAAGSVTFPGGRRSGTITVTPVHSDKVPMPPNFGQQPRFVITIQPGGAHFDPPARVTFPNVDGLAPGQVTELYSFDHDLARFVGIGPGTVTGDGTRIVSDPGVGIAKAGWHGGGDPARPGTCHDCGECKMPSGGACIADDSRTPRQIAPDDCKIERCRGGRAESDMSNQEPAKQIAGNCYEELCPPQYRSLDLADEPAGLRCCGEPSKPLPGGAGLGTLTGTYDPSAQCCVENGAHVISKKAPVDVGRCPKLVPPPTPIEVDFDGCSVPVTVQPGMFFLDPRTPYSGHPDEPTPPANGDALFSQAGPGGAVDPMGPCDVHDRCYQSCGTDRADCDSQFGDAMRSTCEGLMGTLTVPAPSGGFDLILDRRDVCGRWADLYEVTVSRAGGSAHDRGQSSHCDCECS